MENEKNKKSENEKNISTRNNGKFTKGNKEGNRFSSSNQPTSESKKRGWEKRKSLEQIKEEIMEKSFSKINELLDKEDLTSQDLRDIYKTAVEMSGFKKQSQELSVDGIQVSINRKAIDVES